LVTTIGKNNIRIGKNNNALEKGKPSYPSEPIDIKNL